MPESYYDTYFPNLRRLGWTRTSEPAGYNCIAYAAGDLRRWWWPGIHPPYSRAYWPIRGVTSESLEVFFEAFATLGYHPCANGIHEVGYEKVAFYASRGIVTHAARQQQDGTWKSKLGRDEDIRHTLEGLEGDFYGAVVGFAERPFGPIRTV